MRQVRNNRRAVAARGSLPLFAAGLLALAPVPGAARDAKPDATPVPSSTPRYGTHLEVILRQARILVDAPKGQPPEELTTQDFRVLEDGQAVEVASVELLKIPRRTGAPGTEALREIQPLSQADAERVGARRWIVLFDSLNPGPVKIVEKVKADLKRFAREKLGPRDEMAIVFAGTQTINISRFMDDPEQIAREIDNERLRPEDIPNARQVAEGHRGLDDRISDVRRGTVNPGSSAGPTPPPVAQQWLPMGARHFFGTDPLERRTSTGRYLKVIEDLGKGLRVVPGRKVLVVVSAGFPGSDLASDSPTLHRFNQTVRNIMDSGTTVYTIDSNGLSSPIQEEVFAAEHGYLNYTDPVAAEAGLGVDRLRDVSNDFFDKQGGSFLLAHETGGEFFQGSGDFGQAFDRIEQREAGYYLVSWYSSSSGKPGEFRSFDVSVRRPGYRVAGPKGYFAPKAFAKMDALEREADLLGLAEWGGERDELDADARVDVFPDGRGGQMAVISAVLKAADVGSRTKPSGEDAVDLVVAAADDLGGFSYWNRSSLSAAAAASIREGEWWHYSHAFPVTTPVSRLTLVVRENGAGRVLGRAFEVPALGARGLTRPTRIRERKHLTHSAGGSAIRDPFDFGGIHLSPSAVNQLEPGEKLFLFFEAYGARVEDDTKVTYLISGREGERELITGPAPEQVRESRIYRPGRDLVSLLARIPTVDLGPGSWELVVRLDGHGESRYPFTTTR